MLPLDARTAFLAEHEAQIRREAPAKQRLKLALEARPPLRRRAKSERVRELARKGEILATFVSSPIKETRAWLYMPPEWKDKRPLKDRLLRRYNEPETLVDFTGYSELPSTDDLTPSEKGLLTRRHNNRVKWMLTEFAKP